MRMNLLHKFHEECKKIVAMNVDRSVKLERPPKGIDADLALPCFALAKERKKKPVDIANEIAAGMKSKGLVKAIKAEGPYVNFYADWNKIGNDVLKQILSGDYGKGGKQKERIMIEYSSPNSNKPLHIGHLRNDSIGMAISDILQYNGYDVIRANLVNDRGIHICQAMLAYKKWGKGRKPKIKSDHFVGDFYVLYHQKLKEQPELKDEVQQMLVKWEKGDKAVRALWKKINEWAINGFKETYKTFGSRFDVFFHESQFYDKAKPILKEGLKKGIFYRNDKGAIIAKLEPNLPDKIVLREDGTSIYVTNDLALTKHKFQKYKLSRSVWVVASEQNLYFRQLFAVFKKLGYKFADNFYHLSYGLVNLPEGKMKSREGKVIDADELIENVKELALHEVNTRYELPKKEAEARATKIALAAIKYYLLSLEPIKDIMFDPERAVSFEGETGPYLQYTYARARSIIRKSGKKKIAFKEMELDEKEISIVKHLSQYPWVVKKCAHEMKPHYLANYLFELATLFNEFYHSTQVVGTEREKELLSFVAAVADVLKSGLTLLGIDVLEEM